MYYDINKMMSHNKFLNFVISSRGYGKTYGAKKHCINRFLKKQEQFIYLKRYKTDLKGIDQFFSKVCVEFPGATFSVNGGKLKINGKTAGYVIPLSSWQSVKSREFAEVKTIIYDEFLLENSSKQSYMRNEPEALLNLIDSVVRNRNDCKVICLSNAVSIVNPYFLYFNLIPSERNRFTTKEEVLVEIITDESFKEERLKTSFGKLINGTRYGDFALNNDFVGDIKTFISKKTINAKFTYSLISQDGIRIGVWIDVVDGLIFFSSDYDPHSKKTYTINPELIAEDVKLVNKQSYLLIKTIKAFKNGYLRFESQMMRNIGYEIFRQLNIF